MFRLPPDLVATPADYAICRATLRQGSKSFFAASLLLPKGAREPAASLYAFCRMADDLVDLEGGRHAAIAHLQERLALAYAGEPQPTPLDRAFATTVLTCGIPRALPEALLEGLKWDAEGRRYEDLPALEAYAARVAGAVGVMMALALGVRERGALARASDLGTAMQLTNIARDVGEDARAGRIYLPLAWLRGAGLDPDAWLRSPSFTPALGRVIERLLIAADRLYLRAETGIGRLPAACRPGIFAARLLYAEIGHELRRRGLDSVGMRTVVPRAKKAVLAARALGSSVVGPDLDRAPALQASRYLLDAVAGLELRTPAALSEGLDPAVATRIENRVGWLLDLFTRLERQELAGDGPQAEASSAG